MGDSPFESWTYDECILLLMLDLLYVYYRDGRLGMGLGVLLLGLGLSLDGRSLERSDLEGSPDGLFLVASPKDRLV